MVVLGTSFETKPLRTGPNDPLNSVLLEWLQSGTVAGQQVHIKKDGIDQSFRFVEPTPSARELDWFLKKIGHRSVGFGFVRGWFPPGSNRSQFHAYIRVGFRVFHLLDDGQIYDESFRDFEMALLEREGEPAPITHEVVYEASPQALEEMNRYYSARKAGTATISGSIAATAYLDGGFGQIRDGYRLENCQTFALSFAQPQWQIDYPVLAEIHSGRFAAPENGGRETLCFKDIAQMFVDTNPSFIVTWGKPSNGFNPSYPPYEMLTHLRVVKTYKLVPKDFSVTRLWARRSNYVPINDALPK